MTPIVSIIMGSTSDLPVMEKAARFLDEMEIPFEINALSAHRTPREVETFAREAAGRGLRRRRGAADLQHPGDARTCDGGGNIHDSDC